MDSSLQSKEKGSYKHMHGIPSILKYFTHILIHYHLMSKSGQLRNTQCTFETNSINVRSIKHLCQVALQLRQGERAGQKTGHAFVVMCLYGHLLCFRVRNPPPKLVKVHFNNLYEFEAGSQFQEVFFVYIIIHVIIQLGR